MVYNAIGRVSTNKGGGRMNIYMKGFILLLVAIAMVLTSSMPEFFAGLMMLVIIFHVVVSAITRYREKSQKPFVDYCLEVLFNQESWINR